MTTDVGGRRKSAGKSSHSSVSVRARRLRPSVRAIAALLLAAGIAVLTIERAAVFHRFTDTSDWSAGQFYSNQQKGWQPSGNVKLLLPSSGAQPLCAEQPLQAVDSPAGGPPGQYAAWTQLQRPAWTSCCIGCNMVLTTPPPQTQLDGYTFRQRTTQVKSVVQYAIKPDGDEAYVKLMCVPHVKQRGSMKFVNYQDKEQAATCRKDIARNRTLVTVLAVQRLAEECGLLDIIIKARVEDIDAAMPMTGARIRQEALWMQTAPGAPLHALANEHYPVASLQRLLARVPSKQVLKAATFDLLFSMANRHAGDVYFTESGVMTLIDNDDAFRPINSVFLPSTLSHAELQGNIAARTLDYRCHARGGAIDTNYPPQVHACMAKFIALSPEELKSAYGLYARVQAVILQRRARDMLELGFEQALERAGATSRRLHVGLPSGVGSSASVGLRALVRWQPPKPASCENLYRTSNLRLASSELEQPPVPPLRVLVNNLIESAPPKVLQRFKGPYTLRPMCAEWPLHNVTDDGSIVRWDEPSQPVWTSCCLGCDTLVTTPPTQTEFDGYYFAQQTGTSGSVILQAESKFRPGTRAFVKFVCIPGVFSYAAKYIDYMKVEECERSRQIATAWNYTLAMQRLAEECGFADLTVKVWREHIYAAMPVTGFPINQEGLFLEVAPGSPLDALMFDFLPSAQLKKVVHAIAHDSLKRAAIYDLLFSQYDRHPGNVFIDTRSNMRLIDNDQAFGTTDGEVDSVFLPSTIKHGTIYKWDATRVLDYRCHVKGGVMGRDYPEDVVRCMRKFVNSSAAELQKEYGLLQPAHAALLKKHAYEMLSLGFEKTLENAGERGRKVTTQFPPGHPRHSSSRWKSMVPPICT
eukprot:jgi/Chlat1/96/Chrsp1S03208